MDDRFELKHVRARRLGRVEISLPTPTNGIKRVDRNLNG